MKPIWNQIAVLAGVVLTVNVVWADDTQNNNPNSMSPPLTSQQFVSDAAVGGMKEVYLSQMALDKSMNNDVKNFAKHMIKDHAAANRKLEKFAQDGGYAFPATNTFAAEDVNWSNAILTHPDDTTIKGQAAQALMMTNMPYLADYQAVQQLRTATGEQFDQAYIDGMIHDHTATVNEFQNAAQNLSDPKLKKFAEKTLPTLRKHSQMAQELDSRYNRQNAGTAGDTNAMPSRTMGTMPMN